MEFRRAEIRRIYRHVEQVTAAADARAIFEALMSQGLTFSMKVMGMGRTSLQCIVTRVGDESVDVVSREPSKCRHSNLPYDEVESVEVVCNREVIAEESDDGGRWARIT